MGELIQIPPKTITGRHKKHDFEIQYDASKNQWLWEVTVQQNPIHFHDYAPTEAEARAAAASLIDNVIVTQSK